MMFRYAIALRSRDLSQRRAAIQELSRLGASVPLGALDGLLPLLGDVDEAVRDGAGDLAVQAARAGGRGCERVLQALSGRLAQPEDLVRLRAVALVSRIGPAAAPLAPALIGTLKDRNRILCRVATEALCNLGPSAIPALKAAEADPELRVRQAVRWVLSRSEKLPEVADAAETMLATKQATVPTLKVPGAAPSIRPTSERRREPRYPCGREAYFQVMTRRSDDLWWTAKLTDVSRGGVGLVVRRPVNPGDRVALDLREAHAGVQRTAVARIVHCRATPKGWVVGCAWLNLLDDEALRLLREPLSSGTSSGA